MTDIIDEWIDDYLHESDIPIDNLIFHYTTSCTGIMYILKNMSLKLSPFCGVNDPKECKKKKLKFHSSNGINIDIKSQKYPKYEMIMNNLLQKRSKVICFCNDYTHRHTRSINNNYGDLYARGFCKMRMWAQYGESHKGICLGLDKTSVKNSAKKLEYILKFSKSVKYTNSTYGFYNSTSFNYNNFNDKNFETDFIKNHIKKHKDAFFFRKAKDWQDENEYRIVCMTDNEQELFLDITDALRYIILGIDFDQNLIGSLVTSVEEYNIKIYKLNMTDGIPSLIKYSSKFPYYPSPNRVFPTLTPFEAKR